MRDNREPEASAKVGVRVPPGVGLPVEIVGAKVGFVGVNVTTAVIGAGVAPALVGWFVGFSVIGCTGAFVATATGALV